MYLPFPELKFISRSLTEPKEAATGLGISESIRTLAFCALFCVIFLLQMSCRSGTSGVTQSRTSTQQPLIVHDSHSLRVCADPNNLPFSNQHLEGFENKLADLIATELGVKVEYTWWAQRRGFIRNTLKAGKCDAVMGVPSGLEMALTTAPYYRSTYVFVYRKDRHLALTSFDDPRLRSLKIGVQMVGNDFSNTPPAHALTRRGIISNVQGFTLYGDYSKPNPPAEIVDAVATGKVDVAVVWGPLAGYFARRQKVAMEVVPVSPQLDESYLPFTFDISIGVRPGEQEFRDQLERIIERRRPEVEQLLDQFHIPRLGANSAESTAAQRG
jgi:quinoprotein dehydrogenase-associated probable ABC transporter substrate-binding protein